MTIWCHELNMCLYIYIYKIFIYISNIYIYIYPNIYIYPKNIYISPNIYIYPKHKILIIFQNLIKMSMIIQDKF